MGREGRAYTAAAVTGVVEEFDADGATRCQAAFMCRHKSDGNTNQRARTRVSRSGRTFCDCTGRRPSCTAEWGRIYGSTSRRRPRRAGGSSTCPASDDFFLRNWDEWPEWGGESYALQRVCPAQPQTPALGSGFLGHSVSATRAENIARAIWTHAGQASRACRTSAPS